MRSLAAVLLLPLALGCGDSSDAVSEPGDAGPSIDAGSDAPSVPDAGVDAPRVVLGDDGKPPPWRWDEQVARVLDSSTLAPSMGYTPPAGTEAYAALVQENALGLAYAYFDYGGGAFAQSFWPASTVKLLSSLAALDWVGSQGFSGAATVKWDSGFSDTVNAIVDRAIRISSNEDYDRTIRIAGFDQLNAVWLSPERGFPETTIKAAYAGFEVKNPPGYTLTEGGNVKVIPPRAATGSYPCASGKNNCANLFELTEAVRRVVLRELIPAGERFDLAPADLIVLDDALCKATPSFFAKGVSAALGPGASICHKPGWVPGSDSLDHGVIEAADGRRFLLAAAVPDPGDSSSQAVLATLAEKILGVIGSAAVAPFFLQPTAGAELRVKRDAGGLRLQGDDIDGFELFFDGQAVSVAPSDGDTFFASAEPTEWQGKLVTLRGYQGGQLAGVRNLVLD
ncbi:MAG: hypothetical protein KJ015_18845 [Myxococcales bacterium]|nr:hypothetical protein [Myxococcales bacterium]